MARGAAQVRACSGDEPTASARRTQNFSDRIPILSLGARDDTGEFIVLILIAFA